MTSTYSINPWEDLPKPRTGEFSRLRIDGEFPSILFWCKDEKEYPGMLIEISQNISIQQLKKAKINIHDLDINVIDVSTEKSYFLIIRLKDTSNLQIFTKLCNDIIECVLLAVNHEDVFFTVHKRLKKWQALFSTKSKLTLSEKEVQGLFTELYFLAEKLKENPNHETMLIHGWKGPEKTQHDFILGNTAIEIKSIAGHERDKVQISSEDQLHTHLDRLFLRVYFLAILENENHGESLNKLVIRLSKMLTSAENKELFEEKLHIARYIDIPDYDEPNFYINEISTYQVIDDFPRITRRDIASGIQSVSYHIILASIEQFRISDISI